MEQAVKISWS